MSEAVTNPSPFVHLRVHSEFSVVDGIVRIPDLIKRVAKLGQPAVALTDLSNLFGLIKFYKGARGAGVKPIAGCDVWLSNDDDPAKPFRLLLLVRNHQGYLNLCELLTKAFLTNQGKGRAEIRREWLQGQDGLIVLSGGRGGDVGQALDAGNAVSALALARQWAHLFPGSFYIELQRAGMDGDEAYTQAAMRLAAEAGLPVVATHPVQFLDEFEFQAHEARVCIAEGEILANPRRVRRFSKEQYLLSSEEMARRFADVPSALANTVEIAKRCNLSLVLGKPRLPNFPTPEGVTLDDYLVQLSEEGLEKRMRFLFPDDAERESKREQYYERLRWECKTIIQMGFPGYFLIVQDFINWG
ncbi:PHP domain-containing protein, partial [Achromobacter denitrificans]